MIGILHKLRQLRRDYVVTVEPDLLRAVEQAHLLIIAVRPDSVRELLDGLQSGLLEKIRPTHPMMAVSLAAGIPLTNLRRWMGKPVRWARAMPSPVARSGRGLTALTFGRDFPAGARREVRDFFTRVGTGPRNSREQVRRIHRDLLLQPGISRAGRAGGSG